VITNGNIALSREITRESPSSRPVVDGDGVRFGVGGGSQPVVVRFSSAGFASTTLNTNLPFGEVSTVAVFAGLTTIVTFVHGGATYMCPLTSCSAPQVAPFGVTSWLDADFERKDGNNWFVVGIATIPGAGEGPAAAVVDVTSPTITAENLVAPVGEPAGLQTASAAVFDGGLAYLVGTGSLERTHTLYTTCAP
jgi:hypothetical protein